MDPTRILGSSTADGAARGYGRAKEDLITKYLVNVESGDEEEHAPLVRAPSIFPEENEEEDAVYRIVESDANVRPGICRRIQNAMARFETQAKKRSLSHCKATGVLEQAFMRDEDEEDELYDDGNSSHHPSSPYSMHADDLRKSFGHKTFAAVGGQTKREHRGLSHELNYTDLTGMHAKFSWTAFWSRLLKAIFLPFCAVRFVYRTSYKEYRRVMSVGYYYCAAAAVFLYYCLAIALPIIHQHSETSILTLRESLEPGLWYILLALFAASVEGEREMMSGRPFSDLGLFSVQNRDGPCILCEDVVSEVVKLEIRTKHDNMHDRVFIVGVSITAGVHALIVPLVSHFRGVDVDVHSYSDVFLLVSTTLLNFIGAGVIFSLLGVAASVYTRYLVIVRYFSCLTSRPKAVRLDLPHVSLDTMGNISAWVKMRQYLLSTSNNDFLPIYTVQTLLAWSFLMTLASWVIIFVSFFLFQKNHAFFSGTVALLAAYDCLILTAHSLVVIQTGSKINKLQQASANVTLKEKLRLDFQIAEEVKSGAKSEYVEELRNCQSALVTVATLLKERDPPLQVLGLKLGNSFRNVVLAFIISLSAATLSRYLISGA